jgi:hypothetical protein
VVEAVWTEAMAIALVVWAPLDVTLDAAAAAASLLALIRPFALSAAGLDGPGVVQFASTVWQSSARADDRWPGTAAAQRTLAWSHSASQAGGGVADADVEDVLRQLLPLKAAMTSQSRIRELAPLDTIQEYYHYAHHGTIYRTFANGRTRKHVRG